MAFDLKSAAPDTSLPSTGFLFGADSQGASDPSIYSVQALRDALHGAGAGVNGSIVTTGAPLLNMTQTWNAAGINFSAWRINVTDTASAARSLILDLQVAGTTVFGVEKEVSNFRIGGTSINRGIAAPSGDNSLYVRTVFTAFGLRYSDNAFVANGGVAMGFTSGAPDTTSADTLLHRDAADTFAQRRGANAQTSRLYGTYTDTSNYRRVALTMSMAGVAQLKPEGAGTGASGNVLHISGLPASNPGPGILWNDAGTVKVGT